MKYITVLDYESGRVYQYDMKNSNYDWIYYVWSKEDWFNSVNSQELLYNAIQECKEIDKITNKRAIL